MSSVRSKAVLLLGAVAIVIVAGYLTRERWQRPAPKESEEIAAESAETSAVKIIVGDQAQKNLRLTAKSLKADVFWKSISVPGMVVDRPGISDRQVVAPATGIINRIWRVPGESVLPGEVLFTLRLTSEPLHEAQTELYKATQDIELARAKRERLESAGDGIPKARLIEVENEIKRLEVSADANRSELLNRGLSQADLASVSEGKFIREIPIVVPAFTAQHMADGEAAANSNRTDKDSVTSVAYEIQELNVEAGQEVQVGQTLCDLSNHQALAIEGRAFRDEIPLLERSIKAGWPVEVDFQESVTSDWPKIEQNFQISQINNVIDPVTRTFGFLLPLVNQSKRIDRDGRTQLLWRFRPGQKVRLLVRVEELENVFVLPADAVIREGAEAYVFTQNVNTFERKPVHVVHQDRDAVVLANDGSLLTFKKKQEVWTVPAVVRNAAAQLNRMARAGSSATPKGFHVHADGSLHKNEDEAK
jgi:biotin carboxyl carrier protein